MRLSFQLQKLDLVNSLLNCLIRTPIRTLRCPITRMLKLWKQTSVVLLFHHGSRFSQSVQSDHGSKHSDLHSEHSDPQSEHSEQPQRVCSSRAKKHSDKKKHKVWAKYYSQSSLSEDQPSVPVKNLLSLNRLLLRKTNKITQTQSFTGR